MRCKMTDASNFPAMAVGTFDERLRFGNSDGAEMLGIPLDFLAEAEGEVAQQHPFCERPGDFKIRARRRAAFAGANPIQMGIVARDAWESFRRALVVGHARFGQEARMFA